jgi:hypothetical protein
MRIPDWTTTTRTLITIILGGIGAAAGFTHTHDWAAAHGQHGWLAWADAVVIEGMAVVAGFEIHRDHTAHRTGRTTLIPQAVLLIAFVVQMTAQVAQAEPTPAGWLLAAMPALGFLTVVKLAMRHLPAPPNPAGKPNPPQATPPQAASPQAEPASPVTPRRMTATVNRLPATVRQAVTNTAEQAHRDGRSVTADDIRRTIVLPEPMLTNVVTELNTMINNHPAVHEGQST